MNPELRFLEVGSAPGHRLLHMRTYAGYFDVLASYGFVEHFDNPRSVVALHANLLKGGGRLLVTIPNLGGANYLLLKFLHPEILAIHNLSIMEYQPFRELFQRPEMVETFCGYVGAFTLANQIAKHPWRRRALAVAKLLERPYQLLRARVLGARHLHRVYSVPFWRTSVTNTTSGTEN
jgi:hypothetical protein